MTLSIAIATFNEEQNLSRCLGSVASWVDEIVVVDGGSSDRTVQIARSFKVKVIITDNPPIFHINKQKAVDACSGEWILQLDADEVVSDDLKNEILHIMNAKKVEQKIGYFIPRKNYFLGYWLHKGGQYPDYVIRFFQHGKGHFPCKSVHEQIEINGEIGYMKNHILHYSYKTMQEYWKKADTYTSLEARQLRQTQTPIHIFSFFNFNIIKPTCMFLNMFVRHKGFVDGWHGFLFAIFSSLHFPISYIKFVHLMRKT